MSTAGARRLSAWLQVCKQHWLLVLLVPALSNALFTGVGVALTGAGRSWAHRDDGLLAYAILVPTALCAVISVVACLRCEDHDLLQHLLPRHMLQQLRQEWSGKAGRNNWDCTQETPAGQLLHMISQLLEGQVPAVEQLLMARAVLQQGGDVYRPNALLAQLEAQLPLADAEVHQALVAQLVGRQPGTGPGQDTPLRFRTSSEQSLATSEDAAAVAGDIVIMAADPLDADVFQPLAHSLLTSAAVTGFAADDSAAALNDAAMMPSGEHDGYDAQHGDRHFIVDMLGPAPDMQLPPSMANLPTASAADASSHSAAAAAAAVAAAAAAACCAPSSSPSAQLAQNDSLQRSGRWFTFDASDGTASSGPTVRLATPGEAASAQQSQRGTRAGSGDGTPRMVKLQLPAGSRSSVWCSHASGTAGGELSRLAQSSHFRSAASLARAAAPQTDSASWERSGTGTNTATTSTTPFSRPATQLPLLRTFTGDRFASLQDALARILERGAAHPKAPAHMLKPTGITPQGSQYSTTGSTPSRLAAVWPPQTTPGIVESPTSSPPGTRGSSRSRMRTSQQGGLTGQLRSWDGQRAPAALLSTAPDQAALLLPRGSPSTSSRPLQLPRSQTSPINPLRALLMSVSSKGKGRMAPPAARSRDGSASGLPVGPHTQGALLSALGSTARDVDVTPPASSPPLLMDPDATLLVHIGSPTGTSGPTAASPHPFADPLAQAHACTSGKLAHSLLSSQFLDQQLPGSDALARPAHALLTPLERVLQGADEWMFDVFELDAVACGRPLSALGYYLLHSTNVIKAAGLNEVKLARFLMACEDGYLATNPYHNARHAAGVLQVMHVLVTRGGLAPGYADPVAQLGCYLAAVVHDLGHKGRTNDYLIAVQDRLAVRYNDQSPHESHHIARAWQLLRRRELNFLAGSRLGHAEFLALRKLTIELVLATDMKAHLSLMARFNALHGCGGGAAAASNPNPASTQPGSSPAASSAAPSASSSGGVKLQQWPSGYLHPSRWGSKPVTLEPLSEADRTLSLQLALKLADLGHFTCALPVHLQWVSALEQEFFLQGDAERAAGLPISPLCDRTKAGCDVAKSQVGFISVVVRPLFHSFVEGRFHAAGPALKALDANFAYWRGKEAVEQQLLLQHARKG